MVRMLIILMMMAMMMTTKVTTAELGLPASFILCKVEDELQQLYLQVFDTDKKREMIKKKMNI